MTGNATIASDTDDSTGGDQDDSTAGDTDGFFGFLAGLYAAALLAPAVAIWVALRVSGDPGVLYFVILGTAVVVTSGVGWVARRESFAIRLGASRWVWAVMVVPFGYFGVLPAVADGRSGDPPGVVGIALVGAIAGLFVGIGLVVAARNRRAKAALAGSEKLATFTAPAPERDRRMVTRAVAGLFAVGILAVVGSAVLDFPPLRWLFQVLVPAGPALYGSTTSRRVTVSDAGLVVGNPVSKQFRPWTAYESYDVTDDALVLRRAGWSLWGLRDLRRDPADIEDPEAVAAALDELLPRREA
ncbi:hypothetical protein NGM10_04310 [Halorussus salilacus]|uniref:hypothetical protein n=1 Tax=Halorussus salilacus TaxID=2953750 RepID=UPI0020A0704B|nr:hypothetical protein [Halorussus salilacus]USZ68964.1 hypothetical protein NGM10_04310 [Halorussus salilacus]